MFPQPTSYPFEPHLDIPQTHHLKQRMAQRNISPGDLDLVLQYGKEFHCAGAVHVHLRRRDIPARWQNEYARLEGTTIVLSRDETAGLTVHRNRQSGPRRIKRKPSFGYKTNRRYLQ
jgi:hypothetical protein